MPLPCSDRRLIRAAACPAAAFTSCPRCAHRCGISHNTIYTGVEHAAAVSAAPLRIRASAVAAPFTPAATIDGIPIFDAATASVAGTVAARSYCMWGSMQCCIYGSDEAISARPICMHTIGTVHRGCHDEASWR